LQVVIELGWLFNASDYLVIASVDGFFFESVSDSGNDVLAKGVVHEDGVTLDVVLRVLLLLDVEQKLVLLVSPSFNDDRIGHTEVIRAIELLLSVLDLKLPASQLCIVVVEVLVGLNLTRFAATISHLEVYHLRSLQVITVHCFYPRVLPFAKVAVLSVLRFD